MTKVERYQSILERLAPLINLGMVLQVELEAGVYDTSHAAHEAFRLWCVAVKTTLDELGPIYHQMFENVHVVSPCVDASRSPQYAGIWKFIRDRLITLQRIADRFEARYEQQRED